jgi:D-threo-aldose 1-dehydrogenase
MRPSKLGFGTSGIMGSCVTQSGRLRLLDEAFDLGITHFDTAPLYGFGMAESLLGRFARSRRVSISITTKYGLLPPRVPGPARPLVPLARIVYRQLVLPLRGWLRRRPGMNATPLPSGQAARGAISKASDGMLTPGPVVGAPTIPVRQGPPFTPAAITAGLERSLRNLGTDYIDYFLLHECGPEDLQDDVIATLEELVLAGKIRRYGLGTGRRQTLQILEQRSGFAGVVQIPDTLADRDTTAFRQLARPPLFTHSAVRLGADALERLTPAQRLVLQEWRQAGGASPQPDTLAPLLLGVALARNPDGCVLFSTSRPERLRRNVESVAGATLPEAVLKPFIEPSGISAP